MFYYNSSDNGICMLASFVYIFLRVPACTEDCFENESFSVKHVIRDYLAIVCLLIAVVRNPNDETGHPMKFCLFCQL